jgi:GT2 family glycosyltransferase
MSLAGVPGTRPRFSIIVPVSPDRSALVLRSFDELCAPGGGYEVIVERGPNTSGNRNRAIARARGLILAFTDDDCLVRPDWLERAAAFFDRHPGHAVVGGPQLTLDPGCLAGRAAGYVLGSRLGGGRMSRRFREARPDLHADQMMLTSANLFIRRATFDRCGPFDVRLWPNEETALLGRIAAAGERIAYDPSIVVFHERRSSLAALAAQCFRYGVGRARQTRLTAERPPAAVIISSLFLAYLALLPILALHAAAALLPLAAYVLLVGMTTVLAVVRRRDPAVIAVLPAAFVALHLSYPLGFLAEAGRLWIGRGAIREIGGDGVPAPAVARASGGAPP